MAMHIRRTVMDESSPRDPDAPCERCGARGTVARATRDGAPTEIHRYCGACWPAARVELEAARPGGWFMASRTWYDAERYLERLAAMDPLSAPNAAWFAALASYIVEMAPDIEGPMPASIAAFVAQHGASAPWR
jgi:hypothetical protein